MGWIVKGIGRPVANLKSSRSDVNPWSCWGSLGHFSLLSWVWRTSSMNTEASYWQMWVLTFGRMIHVTCMTARLGPFSFSFQWWQLCNRELSQRSVVLWRGDRAQKVLIHLYQRSGAWFTVINSHRCWDSPHYKHPVWVTHHIQIVTVLGLSYQIWGVDPSYSLMKQRSGAWFTIINGHRCWDHRIINVLCEWHTMFRLSPFWVCRIKSKVLWSL